MQLRQKLQAGRILHRALSSTLFSLIFWPLARMDPVRVHLRLQCLRPLSTQMNIVKSVSSFCPPSLSRRTLSLKATGAARRVGIALFSAMVPSGHSALANRNFVFFRQTATRSFLEFCQTLLLLFPFSSTRNPWLLFVRPGPSVSSPSSKLVLIFGSLKNDKTRNFVRENRVQALASILSLILGGNFTFPQFDPHNDRDYSRKAAWAIRTLIPTGSLYLRHGMKSTRARIPTSLRAQRHTAGTSARNRWNRISRWRHERDYQAA